MIKKILFLFFVVFAATAYSQDVTITGTVTDANGNFTITAPSDASLIVSFV
jgi:hypothetical protein